MHNNSYINILADASLPGLEEAFPPPFQLTRYDTVEHLNQLLPEQHILLCRSTLKVTREHLQHHQLRFVATASSGTDHIDEEYLQSRNITLIDAKGCNASSVADYVVSCLAILSQKQLIKNKSAAIIGFGRVGTEVSRRLDNLGYKIHTYDPLKAALDCQFESCPIELLSECGLLFIHADLHDTMPHPSRHLVNGALLNQLQPECIIINASRGEIVHEEALLKVQHKLIYCTDVYSHEPNINPKIVKYATIATPHIAGHSLEAKYLAVSMVSEQLHQHYGLPKPRYAKPTPPMPMTHVYSTWEERVLSLYHPMIETQQLKEATNLSAVFESLRKKHQTRHDFSCY
jgi:erythronate-4-phosphate dehydrogenase